MIGWSAERLREYFTSWKDTASLVRLRDENARVAAEYQRNADKMVEIVRVMDDVIHERQ